MSHVYIGPRGSEEWIKGPAPHTPFQAIGWSSSTTGRNGMMTSRHSRNTHMQYELSWNTVPTETARRVEDWFYGVRGDGLIHWLDPMLANHLPAAWSYPALGATDGHPIYGNVRPTTVTTAANSRDLPTRSAVFTAATPYEGNWPEAYVPIPQGHSASIAVLLGTAVGAVTNSGVIVQKVNGTTPVGAPVSLGGAGTTAAASAIYPAKNTIARTDDSFTGITIRLALGEPVVTPTPPSTITLAGLMVAVAPSAKIATARPTTYVRGGGANGCVMLDPPLTTPISAYFGRTSLSAVLEEVAQ